MLEAIKEFFNENKKVLKTIIPFQGIYVVLIMLFDIYNEILLRNKGQYSTGVLNYKEDSGLVFDWFCFALYILPLLWLIVCAILFAKNADKLSDKLGFDVKDGYRVFFLWEGLAIVWGIIIYVLIRASLWIVPQYGTNNMNDYNGGEYHLFAIYLIIFSFVLFHIVKTWNNMVLGLMISKASAAGENIDKGIISLGKVLIHCILGFVGGIVFLAVALFNNHCAQVPNGHRTIIKELKNIYHADVRLHRIVKNTPMEKEYVYVCKDNKDYKIKVTQSFGAGDNGLILIPLWIMDYEFYEDKMDEVDAVFEEELNLERPTVFFSESANEKGHIYISLDLENFNDVEKLIKDIEYIKGYYRSDGNKYMQKISDGIKIDLRMGDYRYNCDLYLYKDKDVIDKIEYNEETNDYNVTRSMKNEDELREFLEWSFVNGYKDDSNVMLTVPKEIKEKYLDK